MLLVDANEELQQVQCVADAAGFRGADSHLPVAPVYAGIAPTFNPEPLFGPELTRREVDLGSNNEEIEGFDGPAFKREKRRKRRN